MSSNYVYFYNNTDLLICLGTHVKEEWRIVNVPPNEKGIVESNTGEWVIENEEGWLGKFNREPFKSECIEGYECVEEYGWIIFSGRSS